MPSQLFNTYTSNVTTASYTNTYNKIKALADDPFNSIVFDRNRHSIWAQGEEYGYTGFKNLTVNSSYLTAPEFNQTNYVNNNPGFARRFIDGVKYDKDNDSITVSYTYAYESSLSIGHTKDTTAHGTGTSDGDFVRGISVNGHQISYSVNKFSTSDHAVNGDYVVTYAYINSAGVLHYNHRDLSGNTGTKNADTTITNSTKLNVVTGISQTKDGKVSYVYDVLNTTHSSSGASATANQVINNLSLSADGVLSYTYRDLSGNTGTKNANTTITNSTKLNVVTGISQTKDGKVSYVYDVLNTTHSSSGSAVNANQAINNIYLNADGVLSYTYRDLSNPVGTAATAVNINNNTPLNVITALYQTKDGKVSYTYTPLSTSIAFQTTGTKNTDTTITNTTKLNVVTGFSQDSSGKITYVYDVLNTTHSGSASGDFLTSVSLSANGVLSGSAGSFSGNPYGDFLWDVSLGSDGTLSGTAGSISISNSGSGTADQKYVKNVTWNSTSHTLSFTTSYFGGDSGETPITPSVSGTGGGQKFVNSIIFNGTKNHTVSISYCANPAVVCDNNTVKRVRANGATLTFYSS